MPAWSPARYAAFAAERLRPAADLLARVPALSSSAPRIVDLGCGDGGPSALLLDRFPSAHLHCVDSSPEMLDAARTSLKGRAGSIEFTHANFERPAEFGGGGGGQAESDSLHFDLCFANASLHWCELSGGIPALLQRLIGRVVPGGCLAMQVPDTRQQPSHALLADCAAAVDPGGVAASLVAPSNAHGPSEYCDALLGPLCSSLDMWSTTYVQRLEGEHAVFEYVRATGMRPYIEALGGEGSEAARAFEEEYKLRAAEAYPRRADGTTLFPFNRFFLVALRPSLVDVYAEYADYHNHQLDKGWKS